MWRCTKCREEVEDTFEVCWNCGTSIDGTEDSSFRKADEDRATEVSEPRGLDEAHPESTARNTNSGAICTLSSLPLALTLMAIPPIAIFLFVTLVAPTPESWEPYRWRAVVVVLLLLALTALIGTPLVCPRKKGNGLYPTPRGISIQDFGRSLVVGVIATVAATGTFAAVLVCGGVASFLQRGGGRSAGAMLVVAALGIILGVWVGFVVRRKLSQPND